MEIYDINSNKLLLVDKKDNYADVTLVQKLKSLKLDSAIIYNTLTENKYKINVLEKDYSYSEMCGNGCIALCLKFKKDLKIINSINQITNVFYKDNKIVLQLNVRYLDNIFNVGGEKHKVYYVDKYDKKHHINIGQSNLPDYNTTFVFYNNNHYYFSTFERGVNDITKACGTGSFASIYFINYNIDSNISRIKTLENKDYIFSRDRNIFYLEYIV